MSTDRTKIKDQEKGVYKTTAGISDSAGAVEDMHKRTFSRPRPYAANDTAAWTATVASVKRKSRVKAFSIDTTTNIASDNTDYVVFTLSSQHANGAAGATLASWNTHGGAQGAITANVTANATPVSNADAEIAAGMKLRVAQAIGGGGQNVVTTDTTFTVDVEEV